MAEKKISELTAASALDLTETFPVVQSSTTKKATGAQMRTALKSPIPLASRFTTVGTVNAGKDALYTDTIPAGTLGTNGDRLEVEYSGDISAHISNTYGLYVDFGGQSLFNPGVGANLPHPVAQPFNLELTIIRENATTVRAATVAIAPPVTDEAIDFPIIFTNYSSVTVDLSTALDLVLSGEGVVTNDVVVRLGTVTYIPAA